MKKTSASNGLKLRFGLEQQPTNLQVKRWAEIAKRRMGPRYSADQAGVGAAKRVFPDYGTNIMNCEADTIESLLHLAGGKKGTKSTHRRTVKTIRNTPNKQFRRGTR